MEIIKFAIQNHKRYKKTYKSCSISIFISVFLILFFCSIYKGSSYILNNEVDKNYNLKELSIQSTVSDFDNSKKYFSIEDIKELKNYTDIRSISVYNRTLPLITECFVGDKEVLPPDYLTGINVNYNTFSWAKIEAMKMSDSNFGIFVSGRDFNSDDRESCIIDEASVYMLGIKDVSKILNKQIKVVSDDGREFFATIIGVYSQFLGNNPLTNCDDALFYTEEGSLDISSESIILSSDVVDKINNVNEYLNVTISTNRLESTLAILNNLKMRFYNQIVCESEAVNKTLDYLQLFSSVFLFLGSLMLVLSILNLHSTIVMVAEKRKKYFSLQTILGFKKSQIIFCYIVEIIVAVGKGIVFSILSVFLFSFVASFIIQEIYSSYITANISIFFPSLNIMITIISSIIIFIFIISVNISSKISKLDVIKVLL